LRSRNCEREIEPEREAMTKDPFQPLSGNGMPRFGGPVTFMRLPARELVERLDIAFIGVPFDIGTLNRPGARLAPRRIRDESRMLRPYNMATRAAPFGSIRIADVDDVAINTFTAAWLPVGSERSQADRERAAQAVAAHGRQWRRLSGFTQSRMLRPSGANECGGRHSHSIVAGGLPETS
jgi:hypothetical protein